MELLHKFKENGYFTAELYHMLAKKKLCNASDGIVPSEYVKEMCMSTQERLQMLPAIDVANLIDANNNKKEVLSFTPRILVFQNFKQNDRIVAKFSVKNVSKGPTFLSMVFKESSFFFIKPCGGQLLSRLAPGISVTFAVTFVPLQIEDVIHKVTFNTDSDTYVLPIIAMGPRPVFSFPDEIVIPKTPLKVENYVNVPVQNIGMVSAGFTLNTRCPFSVSPKSAYLTPGQKVVLRVGYKTIQLGQVDGTLNAIFETGEIFKINGKGSTETVAVELEKYVIRFLDTYNTMVRQLTMKIINKSNHILTYMCMKNNSIYNDFEDKVKLATMFYDLKDSESAKNKKLVQYDVISSDEHERVYTRIFYDEIQSLVADESLQYQNSHFSVCPIKGKLWPNNATEITITFAPKEIGEFTSTAFLDIDGVKDRIPLKMTGHSLPPAIHLNLETLDMDCVYINKIYNYEIVAFNKGHTNGVIVYKEVPTLFGSKITCTPEMLCLRPGDKDIFVLSFSNANSGPYFEEVNFNIRDTNVILKLYLKGTVIYPSLKYSVPCLDFGMVSLGVPATMEVDVINESVVEVAGTVQISSDGPEISSITLEDYAIADIPKPQLPQWPREFKIQPVTFIVGPDSRISLRVTLTANLIRANQTSLELEVEKSDSQPIVLPILYNARVPEIIPAPDVKLRVCFVGFPYKFDVNLKFNDFWGYFTVQEPEVTSPFDVEIGVKEGIIEPNSTITLPITIQTSILGQHELILRLNLFGLSKCVEVCHITGNGVRPIVTCTPMSLHWGQVKLLNRFQKTLTLCNDSPVYVKYRASLLNKDGRWQIFPAEGCLEPESETDILLVIYLVDANTYTNKAVIQLEKVKDILVPLSATGVGTSIVVGGLRDRIFLGKNFTKILLDRKVVMENCGTRLHALEWSEHYKSPKTKQTETAFFNLDPRVFKMAAGEKVELCITGLSNKVTTVKETWFLIGSVEGVNKKELLMECEITAEFVDPKIELSSSIIDLQYDYGPYSEYYKLTDIVTIKNVSKLPLDIDLSVKPPFAVIQKRSTYKILPQDENLCCCICYNEEDLNVSNIVNEVGVQQSKVFVDYLTMKPVEPLRKGSLHFFQDINKMKMAFSLTHAVEERLEDQDVMKLQILFDTTKHLTLKSRVYSDLMRIKFKGHKNKDAVKLIGKINFPNLLVMSPRVDFQCILNGSIESKTIKIQNITPLLVCYRFQWKKCSITSIELTEISEIDLNTTTVTDALTPISTESNVSNLKEIVEGAEPSGSEMVKANEMEGVLKETMASLNDQHFNFLSSRDSEADVDFEKMRILKRVAPMMDGDFETPFDWSRKFGKIHKPDCININDVLLLIPHRGLLKPGEIQYVHLIFKPKPNVNVRGILDCEILGGPPESIIVTGQSSELIYRINSRSVNFKIRSFHESATEEIIITNIAQLSFEYKTYLVEPAFESELQGTILELVPSEKVLDPDENAALKIVMRTGVVGYYKRSFLLEIGHLPHISIEVFGWGVIPQVYLSLPRPEFANLEPEFGYRAIPTLTLEYLEVINEMFATTLPDHQNSPITEKCHEDSDFRNGWHICTPWDVYPSIMDIELAIERMLVIDHIKLRPDILTTYATTSKMGAIPGFKTTPYVIDYGVVITGSTVQCLFDVTNYGPITTKVHFTKGTNFPSWLTVRLCGKLNAGDTGKCDVVFSPTTDDFTELEETVETYFSLEVPYGVTIPIQIKALCAVPYLASNVHEVNFGTVRCGEKIVMSIPLKNVGKPTCIWYVTLKLKSKSGPNPMMVLENSGKYEPGEGGWLSLAFKPTMEMLYEGLLVFRFHMNPTRMTIPVIGQGIVPQVHIIGPNVTFPPTLPWADTTDIFFGITNPCPFPIELMVAHSDDLWKEEEEIYQLLYKIYNKPSEMLVPTVPPGAQLPIEIMRFYKEFKENVNKALDEESAGFKTTQKSATSAKKSKPVKQSKAGSKEVTPRKFRTEAEIISDEIKALKESHADPLKECLHVFDVKTSETGSDKNIKGLIVILHGSPCEEIQAQEIAYTVGKKLGIPTVNFDHCIVEALCVCECTAKEVILTAINESYEVSKRALNDEDTDENAEEMFAETEDEFEIIFKKIQFLASPKFLATPRSKAADKRKKRSSTSSVLSHSAMGAFGSSTMFQMDLIHELLLEFFNRPKFNRGFVIDSLTSITTKSPPLVLTTVLKCKPGIWNVHLVLCQSEFSKWVRACEESQRENEVCENENKVYEEDEIDEIVQSFEEMDDEEFENAPPELKAIYITYGLECRRKKHYEKVGPPPELPKKEKASGKDLSKSALTVDPSDVKKKVKKDDTKGKPNPEYVAMLNKYNEYTKVTYEALVHIANNWVFEQCDLGYPLYALNGQLAVGAQKKTKKKSEVQIQVSEVTFSERGFPLSLVMYPCIPFKYAIVDMFLNAPIIQEALKEDNPQDILKCPVTRLVYTVLLPRVFPSINFEESLKWQYLDEQPIKKCECNQLTDLHLLDDSTQDNVMNILSKWHCVCGKKMVSSQTSTSGLPYVDKISNDETEESESERYYPEPEPLRKVISKPTLEGRIVLQPGDLLRCKYSFDPKEEGHFSLKRFVEVCGWPDSRVDINVSGICDIPRLDSRPKKMFANFIRRTVEDELYKLAYLDDRKLFEFGSLFVGLNRIYEEEYTIDLKNSSLITADVVIEFLEDTNVFQIDKTYISLEPGCRGKLTITAAPVEVGVHRSVLLFCVKDNPEIITITIGCNGITPVVKILPISKSIDFGKFLLYRREDERFIVKNDSVLPIMWKIRNASEFVEDFIIGQTKGIVSMQDNQVVPVTYIASRVGVISNKTLTIDIYDALGRGDPIIVDNLLLSAECYDVMVECAYENPTESFLNYGNVKVNSNVNREMYLLNKGKYNIYYRLKKVKNFPEPALLRSFVATPECGIIPPSLKLITIDFNCTPTVSLNLVNVPAYICSLLDGSKDQVVVAKFPVYVTIASFYNTFTLFPLGELNFHIIAVGSGVAREVILNNTSKCPFTYEIIVPEEYQVDPSALPAKPSKDNKLKVPPIRCGNFLILNEDNLLPPGTSRTIHMQFFATAARKFEETIKFVISDTCPAEAQGVPLRLVGIGAMPSLDFWNLETTFREHLILKSLAEYLVPESSPHCVFVENSVTLHFFCVNVNSSHTGVIDLYNNGLVACVLSMKLHYQHNSNPKIFSLDMYDAHIEPLLHKNLGIIFSPAALEEYRAVLELRLKLLDNRSQSFKICLIGEGVIPRIHLVSPTVKLDKIALLHFPLTCLGSISNKTVRFRNISTVTCFVVLDVAQPLSDDRPVFWLNTTEECAHMIVIGDNAYQNKSMKVKLQPSEIASIQVFYNPLKKGKIMFDVKLTIEENPYEYFTVMCEAEAFMEDVILVGLEMLPMDIDLESYRMGVVSGTTSTGSTLDSRKKNKSASLDKKGTKSGDAKKGKKISMGSGRRSDSTSAEPSPLKYILDFGGCELCTVQRRTVIMINNSEKVYKFKWEMVEFIVTKPSMGYISPAEEKDIEIMFFSAQPVTILREFLVCNLNVVSDDSMSFDLKTTTWDSRQIITMFDKKDDVLNQRSEVAIEDQTYPSEGFFGSMTMIVVHSAVTEYTKYSCTLKEEYIESDTYIYQTRTFDFKVQNVGNVPMKISWSFNIDDEYPSRIDKYSVKQLIPEEPEISKAASENEVNIGGAGDQPTKLEIDSSKITLFSESMARESVDTWFEIDLPFTIEPNKACLAPKESQVFKVTFAPLEAFDFKVRLKSSIDNLDPYDQNISCKIFAKSLIPYVHLDIEESDYLTSGRRKVTGVALAPHMTVLEFDVLGWGCYKKTFNVINPTTEAYEFMFETYKAENKELVPVHCNMLKGFVEGGTSTEVTFTFSPTAPGVYESQWRFVIPKYTLTMNLLVVGIVREPEVVFVPTILLIRNSLVGFTSTSVVNLKNNETESLNFEFKGDSLCNESGKTPVIVEPDRGVLKPRSETPIKIIYTPIVDGPLSFKIFCSVTYLTKILTLCVNALSHSIRPTVTYYLIGNEHVLNSDVITNIHLEQTASTYERTIPFKIKNDGSATFFYDWHYSSTAVKKYLEVYIEPKSGHVTPGNQQDCTLHFTLKKVPVLAFPVTLNISDGPEYSILLNAEIEKPSYHFSCKNVDFGKCIINAPDKTYYKYLAFINDDEVPVLLNLNFTNLPELFIDYHEAPNIQPGKRLKIGINFRPKKVEEYEFKIQFWVNSLCEEIITVKGEGIPLLFDLYEGCQKSFDLGPVKVGEKIIRTIEVTSHTKIPIDATFIFRDMYPVIDEVKSSKSDTTSVCLSPSAAVVAEAGPSRVQMLQSYKNEKIKEQIEMDTKNALSSLKVVPSKCVIQPFRKVPLKIQFKPVGLISNLDVQLNMKVLSFERPLVKLSGSATGMSLCFSQNSLQFGRVRKRGCKILKVLLMNKGDFGARFWWQPMITEEFTITPQTGTIAARTNVTFTVTFRPINHNPFIKLWASCNIENYKSLELAMYATCLDGGTIQNKTMYLECPVREVKTEYVVITNPSDDMWLVLSENSGGPFDTLKEFNVEPNSVVDIPVYFKPMSIGTHETTILYSPLGETALFVNVTGIAGHPNPTGEITFQIPAKQSHTENLLVHNITEFPEKYEVSTEVVKTSPDKFYGFFEITHPDTIKVWGEATATCRWTFICYEECEMLLKVLFINVESREYQYYNIRAVLTPSPVVDTLEFVSRARETFQRELVVKNSLATEADYLIRCEKLITPEVVNIGRKSEAIITMSYSPLVVGETEDILEVANESVGSYIYKVKMTCLPAKVKELTISTPLGTRVPMRLRVTNNTETKTEFITMTSHSSIQADHTYSLGPLEKGKFLVYFEPTELGVQKCTVSFNSPVAGEFVFSIKGTGTEPKPQGPFEVKAGGSTTIVFKNVFEETRIFKVYVDRQEFSVKTLHETVKSKKELKVIVNLSEKPFSNSPKEAPTGTLTIENFDPPEPKVQWMYFLQGRP